VTPARRLASLEVRLGDVERQAERQAGVEGARLALLAMGVDVETISNAGLDRLEELFRAWPEGLPCTPEVAEPIVRAAARE
jgi:hypothetical protein